MAGILNPIYSLDLADLRVAMVQRERLSNELIRVKGRVINWLDWFFPEYPQVSKKWGDKASIATKTVSRTSRYP